MGEFSDGKLDELEEARACIIYVVRDSDLIFYVGTSENVIDRLHWHLGEGTFGWGSTSQLERLFRDNLPAARDWQVELLTTDDCVGILERITDLRFERESTGIYLPYSRTMQDGATVQWRQKCTKEILECRLIQAYRPCLNADCNPTPTPLPEKYQRPYDFSSMWRKAYKLLGMDSESETTDEANEK
jgi:hypothetical protein